MNWNKTNLVKLLLISLFVLVVILPRSVIQAQGDPVNEIILRVNALRATYGVTAYEVDYALMAAAQMQADWCAENNEFGHLGPGGSTPDDRAKAAGYGAGQNSFAIENIAAGTASLNTPELVVSMWQNDWGHLNAMISAEYEHIGVGYAEANDFSWYIMMVGWVGDHPSVFDPQIQETSVSKSASLPFVLSEPDESGAIYHEVQPGQNAWTIAAQYGITLAKLYELNNLTESSILRPGDVLMIRPPISPTSSPSSILASDLTPQVMPTLLASQQEMNSTPTSTLSLNETTSEHPYPFNGNTLENSARPDTYLILLVVGLGVTLLVGIILISRSRKELSDNLDRDP